MYEKEWFDKYLKSTKWDDNWYHVANNIIRYFKPASVFEVGCGKGFLVKALNDKKVPTKGCDISKYAIKNAFHKNCYNADASKIPEKDNSYELVCAIDVLEHLEEKDQQKTISEIKRITTRFVLIRCPMYPYQNIHLKDPTMGHISCKPVWFWVEQFCKDGFILIGETKSRWTNKHLTDTKKYDRKKYPFGINCLCFEKPHGMSLR